MLSPDDTFVSGIRQRPIRKKLLAEWKLMSPEDFVTGETAHGYNRNSLLVDLTKTPQDIKEDIINTYKSQTNKEKQSLLNYFIKNKMMSMVDVIDEF